MHALAHTIADSHDRTHTYTCGPRVNSLTKVGDCTNLGCIAGIPKLDRNLDHLQTYEYNRDMRAKDERIHRDIERGTWEETTETERQRDKGR